MPNSDFNNKTLSEQMKDITLEFDYLANMIIFMAAYDFGRRAERGENVTEEMEAFKTSMKERSIAKGMSE